MHGNISRASSSSSISSASPLSRADLTSALSSATRSLSVALSNVHRAQAEIDHISQLLANLPLSSPHPILSSSTHHILDRTPRVSTPSPEPCSNRRPSRSTSPALHPLLPNGSIQLGDQVHIRNPREFQQSEGSVIGVKGQFILVRTPNDDIVRRIERNLLIVRRHYSFSSS